MNDEIDYEYFKSLDIRVAKVTNVEFIEGADKLLKITLDVGDLGERTVAAGIKEFYKSDELIGRLVVYLANLKARDLKGVISQGMLLAADDGKPVLLKPDFEVVPGSIVR